MGLFGKLFEKKVCDICGGDIGLLGNRKLEDGNCCKECAAKLSPWFNERRQSSVADIKEQIEYREENKAAVAAFHTTRTLGRNTKVLLDEDAGVFMVTSARNLSEANPDVIAFSQVTGCDLDIEEHKTEEKRQVKDSEGHMKSVSYNPPRYKYSYDFYMIIRVNTRYFDEIKFKLNSSSVEVDMKGRPMANTMMGMVGQMPLSGQTSTDPRMADPDYAEFYTMGMEIKTALTQIHAKVREDIAKAEAPKMAITCPWCGATTIPDAAGCCEYCGGSLKG